MATVYVRRPDLGYCQSMNFLVGMLLIHMDEKSAFWTLAAIIEKLLPEHFYSDRMTGMRVEQRVLESCLQWKLPKLHQHIVSHDVRF